LEKRTEANLLFCVCGDRNVVRIQVTFRVCKYIIHILWFEIDARSSSIQEITRAPVAGGYQPRANQMQNIASKCTIMIENRRLEDFGERKHPAEIKPPIVDDRRANIPHLEFPHSLFDAIHLSLIALNCATCPFVVWPSSLDRDRKCELCDSRGIPKI
jgi:hypothetical protein